MHVCPHCQRRLPAKTAAKHELRCAERRKQGGGEQGGGDISVMNEEGPVTAFDWEGVTFQVGLRVQTQCCLADQHKREHPKGTTGTIHKVIEKGLMTVMVDDAQVRRTLVAAEPADLLILPPLAVGTLVKSMGILLKSPTFEKELKKGVEATVVEYVEERVSYVVRIPSEMMMAEVPANFLIPVVKSMGAFRKLLSFRKKKKVYDEVSFVASPRLDESLAAGLSKLPRRSSLRSDTSSSVGNSSTCSLSPSWLPREESDGVFADITVKSSLLCPENLYPARVTIQEEPLLRE